jgi:hypothetical protein
MDTENDPSTPVGFILIATFWILLGAFILSFTSGYLSSSHYYSPFGIIPLMMGIGAILLGWGILTLQRWAYLTCLIVSLLGLLMLLITVPSLISSLFGGYYLDNTTTAFLQLIPFLFIPMVWYLFKKGDMFRKRQITNQDRICPNCGRFIPFDANNCPYCEKKFQIIIDRP